MNSDPKDGAKLRERVTALRDLLALIQSLKSLGMNFYQRQWVDLTSWENQKDIELQTFSDLGIQMFGIDAAEAKLKGFEAEISAHLIRIRNRAILLNLTIGIIISLLFLACGLLDFSNLPFFPASGMRGFLWVLLGASFGTVLLQALILGKTPTLADGPTVLRDSFADRWPIFLVPIIIALGLAVFIATGALDIKILKLDLQDFWSNDDAKAAILIGLFAALSGERAISIIGNIFRKTST
jgi:hypothetical protein